MDSVIGDSPTLLNAQLSFLATRVCLIHIPLEIYPLFAQPILRLLLLNQPSNPEPDRPWLYWHPFVNIALTPTECSIALPRHLADQYFLPLVPHLPPKSQHAISISREDFTPILIGGEGLDPGPRVLDLTAPLAQAGIPIFFITAHYADFILVPLAARGRVIAALEARGFIFTPSSSPASGETGWMSHPSPTSSPTSPEEPKTPPPTTLLDLQKRTFTLLAKAGTTPALPDVELVTCSGIKLPTPTSQEKLLLGLTKCLLLHPPPTFLSLTLTSTEAASLTLDKTLLPHFPDAGEEVLLGMDGPVQRPITFDLRALPEESEGIVCGVASRLLGVRDGGGGMAGGDGFGGGGGLGLSFLSTARAAHVVVFVEEVGEALEALGIADKGKGEVEVHGNGNGVHW